MKNKSIILLVLIEIILVGGCKISEVALMVETPKENKIVEDIETNDKNELEKGYYDEILKKFQENEYLRITVQLKDGQDNYFQINLSKPLTQRIINAKLRDNYFRSVQKDILSKLVKNDYELIGELSRGFAIRVNKRTYLQLQDNPNVEEIYPERESFIN